MKVELDENLGAMGAEFLKSAGFDVATVADQQLTSAPDAAVARICAAEGRCLVTLDKDFSDPLRYRRKSTPASSSFGCLADSNSRFWNARWLWSSRQQNRVMCAGVCGSPRSIWSASTRSALSEVPDRDRTDNSRLLGLRSRRARMHRNRQHARSDRTRDARCHWFHLARPETAWIAAGIEKKAQATPSRRSSPVTSKRFEPGGSAGSSRPGPR